MDIIERIHPWLYCQEVIEQRLLAMNFDSDLDGDRIDTIAWRLTQTIHGDLSETTKERISPLAFKTLAVDALHSISQEQEEQREEEEEELEHAKQEAKDDLEGFIVEEGELVPDDEVIALGQSLLAAAGLRLVPIKGGKYEVRKGRKRIAIPKQKRPEGLLSSLADAIDLATKVNWIPERSSDPGSGATYWANHFTGRTIGQLKLDDYYLDIDERLDDGVEDLLEEMGSVRFANTTAAESMLLAWVRNAKNRRQYAEYLMRMKAKDPVDSRRVRER